MSGKPTKTRARSPRTDPETLRRLSDADIDYSDIAETDKDFWKEAELLLPQSKTPLSLRLDQDVLDWFKSQGPGYQTRMNAVLRAYMRQRSRKSIGGSHRSRKPVPLRHPAPSH